MRALVPQPALVRRFRKIVSRCGTEALAVNTEAGENRVLRGMRIQHLPLAPLLFIGQFEFDFCGWIKVEEFACYTLPCPRVI